MKKWIYLISTGIIFILSFRFFSSVFYPLFNSDNAVPVLMIHYFKLPHDLYYWGIDRLGSLIPLLAQVFFIPLDISALMAESLTHYLILLAGYLAFASFFKLDKIYLNRDMWMESFPDSLQQFNRKLVREGYPFRIGNSNVCEYRVIR